MFKRVILEDWVAIIPVVSFVCLFGVFLGATIITLLKSKSSVKHLSHLPLDDDSNDENS